MYNLQIRLHAYFYHKIPMDCDSKEKVIKMKLKNDDEKIQYKQSSHDNDINDAVFGAPFTINKRSDAKFKNHKQEILKNEYHTLKAGEWNELLRKCIIFDKSQNAKSMGLNMKEIVALKLYTDFDQLRRYFLYIFLFCI